MSITISRTGAVATVVIDRPDKRNAITRAMRLDLQRGFEALRDDPAIRAIVLTGAGDHFSAGADTGEMVARSPAQMVNKMSHLHRMAAAVAQTEKPVIAAVRGYCVGVAWALALACDFVIVADDARFQAAFRNLGLVPDGGLSFLLARHIGLMRAKEIVYSARLVSGAEAVERGLALRQAPAATLLPEALAWAAELAAGPTLALGLAKRQFVECAAQTFDQALALETAQQALATFSHDHAAAVDAFRAGRPMVFTGD